MHIQVYVHIYIYIHTYIHTYIYIYIHIYTYVHTYIHCRHTYTHICIAFIKGDEGSLKTIGLWYVVGVLAGFM